MASQASIVVRPMYLNIAQRISTLPLEYINPTLPKSKIASQAVSNVARPSDAELLQAQADLWRVSLSYQKSISLRCAVELGIPTAIHHHGGAASPADLITALSLPSAKLPFLRRLLRLLAAEGVFTIDKTTKEERYSINPVSYLLVDGIPHEVHINHSSLVLTATSTRFIEAATGLAEWFKKDVVTPPFEELHGAALFHESLEGIDPDYHNMANEALDAHDNFGAEIAMREFKDLFEGIPSMTYLCGTSDDKFARAIVKAYPHIKCTVLAPPKVIAAAKLDDGVKINYVEGDMFNFIPPAQIVALKLVLHHFTDEDCVKILTQCRKAIPSRENGGRVLIADIVIDYTGPMLETHLLMDLSMMTQTKGWQRDESEWRELFKKAGFSDYKILKEFGARAVIELYP